MRTGISLTILEAGIRGTSETALARDTLRNVPDIERECVMRFITRAGLAGFRCYEKVDVELDHVTIFAGPNNSGKSAVLRALRRLASVDLNRHPRVAERGGAGFWGSISNMVLAAGDPRDAIARTVFSFDVGIDLPMETSGERVERVHARFNNGGLISLFVDNEVDSEVTPQINPRAEAVVSAIERLPIVVLPEVRGVPDAFQVRYEQDDSRFHEEVVDAAGLLSALVQWSCVEPARIASFTNLVSEFLGEPVNVAVNPRDAVVRVGIGGDSPRDVHDVGSGVVEVLTLALALTLYDRGLLLYEEPELHLHPRVQRRVITKLRDIALAQRWQVLITTHSNHVLDHGLEDGITTVAVSRRSGTSRLETLVPSVDRGRLHQLFDELGVRPSSGLQSQALLWVEGPSDAAYLRFFLKLAAPDLSEYIDYSFAFFGGSLLAHHAAEATATDGLIDILGIHRRSFVILDSDRLAEGAELGKAYAREFCARAPTDRLWISWGREIEK